jgi:hypothetical protein
MTENEIRIKLLKAAKNAHRNLAKVYKGLAYLEDGNVQAAQDSIPPGDDPPDPPGDEDDDD